MVSVKPFRLWLNVEFCSLLISRGSANFALKRCESPDVFTTPFFPLSCAARLSLKQYLFARSGPSAVSPTSRAATRRQFFLIRFCLSLLQIMYHIGLHIRSERPSTPTYARAYNNWNLDFFNSLKHFYHKIGMTDKCFAFATDLGWVFRLRM